VFYSLVANDPNLFQRYFSLIRQLMDEWPVGFLGLVRDGYFVLVVVDVDHCF